MSATPSTWSMTPTLFPWNMFVVHCLTMPRNHFDALGAKHKRDKRSTNDRGAVVVDDKLVNQLVSARIIHESP